MGNEPDINGGTDIVFSVIVPIYKIEDYLEKCINSLLSQTFQNFELLLIDDGSPDRCPEICESYAKKDRRIRVIHKKNGGLVSARNTGVKNVRGDYICYVDGDDWVEADLLENLYQIIRSFDKPDMVVFGGYYEYGDRQEKIPCHVAEGRYEKNRLEREIYPYMIYDSKLPFFEGCVYPAAWNKIYKRELLQNHYCRDERISLAEDNAFVFECMYYADTVCFIDKALYHYNRCREDSMISRYDCRYFEKIQMACNYLEKSLSNCEQYLKKQINVFKAAWLIMAVFHEVRFQKQLLKARKHVSFVLRSERTAKKISLKGLPVCAKVYIVLLKMNCCLTACILAKVLTGVRKGI